MADPVLDVPAPDVTLLPPVRSEQLARAEPCTRDAVRCAARSCAATELAVAAVQWASLVLLLLESVPVAALASAESQEEPESQPEPLAAAQPADVRVVQQVQLAVLWPLSLVVVPLAAQAQKKLALAWL